MKIILLGAPGAGKGTISDLLSKDQNLVHISTGNLFREAIQKDDDLSWQIKNILNAGGLVSDDITNAVARNAILKVCNENKGFILDGYPRTINQAKFLDTIVDIDKVFYLKVDNDALIKRIIGRRVCPNCNAIYNINLLELKPKIENECDVCHSVLVQRKDDNLETAQKRIDKYNEETFPLIEFYKAKNKLVEINGLDTIQNIYNNILKYE
ncbi:MAG: nucleoside monophosphate kinase [Ureaplasma sp.]|nr:nucleoside monophosphate kinase [Ureaplasma sp.]